MSVSSTDINSALASESVLLKIGIVLGGLFLIIFPASITSLPSIHGVINLLAVMLALIFLIKLDARAPVNKDDRFFFLSMLSLVVVLFCITAYDGFDSLALKKFAKFLYLAMVIPVFVFYRIVGVRYSLVWCGLVVGAAVSAAIGLYQVTVDPIYNISFDGRATGGTNEIIFGDISLLLGSMSLAGIGWFKSKSNRFIIIPVIAFVLGLLASVLSQSRGGWVAVPFIVFIFFWFSSAYISRWLQVVSVAVLIALLASVYYIPQTGVQGRVQGTIERAKILYGADINDSHRGTSIGMRLEQWQAAWQIFLDHPLIGVGLGNYQVHAQALVDKKIRSKFAAYHEHPHNQFLSVMVSGGGAALIAICVLFLIPIRIFYKACKSPERSDDAQRVALAGIVLMVGFAIFNLSESLLERSRTLSFFIFYLAVFMAGIRETKLEAANKSKRL